MRVKPYVQVHQSQTDPQPYFLAESFSLGVEAQLNVSLSGDGSTRFGNPGGTNINSAMGVFAAVYF